MKIHVSLNYIFLIIFYLNSSITGRPNERKIVRVIGDSQQFSQGRINLNPNHSSIIVDETNLQNQIDALDIANTIDGKDFRGLEKYYVDLSTQIFRRGNWRPRQMGTYTPTADSLVTFQRSQERIDFDDNVQAALSRLATIAGQSTSQEIRDLAVILRRYMRFDIRRERPN